MTEHIPLDLYAFIQTIKQNHLEDFAIDLTNNSQGEGYHGDVTFLMLTNKKTGEKQFLTLKQQKIKNGKIIEWSNKPFENEIYFYDTVWSTLNKMYFEKTGKMLDFVPHCLGTSKDGVKRIVMENLKIKDFYVKDKTKHFEEEHFKHIFRMYGIFHGLSMSFKEENFEEFSRWTKTIHHLWIDMFNPNGFVGKSLGVNARAVLNLFDAVKEKHLYDSVAEYEKHGRDIIYNLINRDQTFRVIRHGDCWSNNVMFKYNVSIPLYFNCLSF